MSIQLHLQVIHQKTKTKLMYFVSLLLLVKEVFHISSTHLAEIIDQMIIFTDYCPK